MAWRERAVAGLVAGTAAALLCAAAGPVVAAEGDPPKPVFRFGGRQITESSGLVLSGRFVVTANDSGDRGRVFVVDPSTGDVVGVTTWQPAPTDVEALAPAGEGRVWVGDIGDNRAKRTDITVYQVPVGDSRQATEPTPYPLAYPEGPANAEALLAHPDTGRLYVATKGLAGGTLYELPETLDPDASNELVALGRVPALVTDGAFFPDGRHLVLRTYTQAMVYTFPGLELLGTIDLPRQRQGEGIAVDQRDGLWLSSEGPKQPVYRVELPAEVTAAILAGPSPSPTPSPPGSGEAAESDEGVPVTWWPWAAGAVVLLVGGGFAARRRTAGSGGSPRRDRRGRESPSGSEPRR